jgi:2-polyprenyl-3-methyl-5-hydroxy-6-metoxy-1,4-benzoquinol methylase
MNKLKSLHVKVSKKELFYDDFADRWEARINNLETNKRLQIVFHEFLTKKDLKNKTFLEVGCGLGYFSERALSMGAKVTGIDVGSKLVKKTKDRVPGGRFLTASAAKLPFKNNTFDIVLCTEVIEHVEFQQKTLKEMFRVLKHGGVLVITTPNRIFKPAFDLLSYLKIRPYRGNENWIYQWKLKKMLVKLGFRIDKERFFNFIFPNNILDKLEFIPLLNYLTINYGFRLRKN